jgi:hypothetical protein
VGAKRRAKTDKADAQLLRELLAAGRVPECYIPPSQVLEWRALLELYRPVRMKLGVSILLSALLDDALDAPQSSDLRLPVLECGVNR